MEDENKNLTEVDSNNHYINQQEQDEDEEEEDDPFELTLGSEPPPVTPISNGHLNIVSPHAYMGMSIPNEYVGAGLPTIAEKSDWRSLYVATFLSFCCAVQFSLYFSSLWPFLQIVGEIDKPFVNYINHNNLSDRQIGHRAILRVHCGRLFVGADDQFSPSWVLQ
jgi:hypothetical protein